MVNELVEELKLLIELGEKRSSINRISKLRGVNYKTAYLNIQKLRKFGLALVEEIGNASLCSFSYKMQPLVCEAEVSRRDAFLRKNSSLQAVFRQVSGVESPFFSLLVFGSYAKGLQSKGSDIDLALIASEDASREVQRELSILQLKMHITALSAKEFIKSLKTREFNVCHEIKAKNIILSGIENYYGLLKNAI